MITDIQMQSLVQRVAHHATMAVLHGRMPKDQAIDDAILSTLERVEDEKTHQEHYLFSSTTGSLALDLNDMQRLEMDAGRAFLQEIQTEDRKDVIHGVLVVAVFAVVAVLTW
ncbi:hypothetical protein GCM10023116_16170 [Kistimonas scapharcae]|uniref:DUF1640 domain-containing protein n=1 Tax=Kistimonas scapharcae TaxID=1036133 RepID=A0ABP8V1P9_9GAMM